MARQRFIWPDFWKDHELGRASPIVRLFFIGAFSNADDDGRLLGDPAYLRSEIFPYDALSLEEVEAIRDAAVEACPNLILYDIPGDSLNKSRTKPILAFTKWRSWQKPKYPKPSKLPAPPRKRKDAGLSQKSSGNVGGSLPEDSGKPSETFLRHSGTGLGRDGLGREDEDQEPSLLEPNPPTHPELQDALGGWVDPEIGLERLSPDVIVRQLREQEAAT